MKNYAIITNVNNIDKKKWYEFVYNHPHGNVFQTPEMYEVYQNTKNYEPVFLKVVNSKDEISGTLLSVIQKESSGVLGNFTARSIIQGGPLIKDDDPDVLDFILKEYDKAIKKKAIYSQFRNFWDQENNKDVFEKYSFKYKEHLNILVDLTIGEEALFKTYSKRRRGGIRKAIRNNFTFEISNSKEILSNFYSLLQETYSNAKLPYPFFDFFENIQKIIPENNMKFFILKKDDKILVILLALIYKGCLSAFYIGTSRNEEFLRMKPVDLLYWEVMKWGVNNECRVFDWLGAGKPNKEYGVRKFKLQFGGNVLELGRYEKIHKPLLMQFGRLGLKLWQKIKK